MKFSFVTIHITDLEPSIKFYEDIIGLSMKARFQAGPNQEIVFFDGGGFDIELIAHSDVESISHDSHLSIAFAVKSLDDAMKEMEAKGIKVDGPISPNPQTKFFFITDPNGVTVQIIEESH